LKTNVTHYFFVPSFPTAKAWIKFIPSRNMSDLKDTVTFNIVHPFTRTRPALDLIPRFGFQLFCSSLNFTIFFYHPVGDDKFWQQILQFSATT